MIGTTEASAQPETLEDILLNRTFSHVEIRVLLIASRTPNGHLKETVAGIAERIGCNYSTVQRAFRKLEQKGVLALERDKGKRIIRAIPTQAFEYAHLGKRVCTPGQMDTNTWANETHTQAFEGGVEMPASEPDRNKSSNATTKAKAKAKAVHGGDLVVLAIPPRVPALEEQERGPEQQQDHHHEKARYAQSSEPKPRPEPATDQTVGLALGQEAKAAIEQEPKILTGWPRIQELWPHLTRDVFDLAWCQTMANRYGLAKLVDALETCFLKSIHQDTLNGPLKAYVTRICQNHNPDPIRSVQPPPKPDMLERLMAGEFRT